MPIFRPLPSAELEALALALEPVELPAGATVMQEGDDGDRYFAIASGDVEVIKHGQVIAVLGRGEGFGEIALLHGVTRTATVKARTDGILFSRRTDGRLAWPGMVLFRIAGAKRLAHRKGLSGLDD